MISSFLGLYYEEQTEIDPLLKPAKTSPLGSFAKSNSEGQIWRKIYKHGHPVRVVYNESEGIYGHLNLPAKLGSGCSWSPVQYLVDSTAKCSKILTPDKCSKNITSRKFCQIKFRGSNLEKNLQTRSSCSSGL